MLPRLWPMLQVIDPARKTLGWCIKGEQVKPVCSAMVTMWWPCLVLALLSGLETSGFQRSPLRLLGVSLTSYLLSEL